MKLGKYEVELQFVNGNDYVYLTVIPLVLSVCMVAMIEDVAFGSS